MARRVLVTGVARFLGARFAALASSDPGVEHVVGTDAVPARHELGGADFVRVEPSGPGMSRILADRGIDTVVHLNVLATPGAAGGRASMKDINVLGTMSLLAACAKAAAVQTVVVKSSGAVYLSSPRDPALFSEDLEPTDRARGGFAKDSVEVEGYVRGFARRRPDARVSLLRFADILGPDLESALTTYFSLPVWPTPAGYDARLQFVHESDGLEVLRRAMLGKLPGTFNVAGDGVLTLSQAARRAGRITLPLPRPIGGWLGESLRRAGVADFSPDQMEFLSYGRVLDCTRLHTIGRFHPRYSSLETFDEFVEARLQPVVQREWVASAERTLTDLLS